MCRPQTATPDGFDEGLTRAESVAEAFFGDLVDALTVRKVG
jgi:hypothetical protein